MEENIADTHKLDQKYRREKFVFRFCNDVAKTCSYRSKLATKFKIKYLVHLKAYFRILSIFRTGCLSTLNTLNPSDFILTKFNPSRIKFRQYF